MRIFGFDIRRSARRFLSSEFEDAVNKALTADMVADKTSRPVITPEGSLALTAVWACVRILSETVGTLPIHLYRRMPKGRERQYAHPSAHILQRPNSYSTRFDMMHFLMISCTLWGNGYARIYRDRLYRPVRLKYYHPAKVTPVLIDNEELFYRLDSGEMLAASDMIHLKGLSTDGIVGKSPIAVHRDNLALSVSAQTYGEMFFNQGGNMSGVFKYPSTLKPEAYERLKRDLLAQSVCIRPICRSCSKAA